MKKNYRELFVWIISWMLFTATIYAGQEIENVEQGYVNNNGVKIHYVTLGKGPIVLMIHGFPDFWYTWRDQMESLSDQFKVVAMDLRGYNLSDKPKGVENYAMKHLISDIVAVVKHFEQDKAIIIGHDWGGAIAWQVAMWYPNLVERLIVLSTPHPNGLLREIQNNTEQKKNSQYARDFQKEDAHKGLTAEGLAGWVKDDKARKKYIEAFNRSDFEAMLNYYKASFPSAKRKSSVSNSNTKSKPRVIKCPTLAIFGLEDKALLPSGWNGTWDWVEDNLTLVSIPGAGHFVQHDASEVVTNTIVSWLNKKPFSGTTFGEKTYNKIKPFNELIGTWTATQSIRNQDGSWSEKPEKYIWNFYSILDGEAIQDDWIVNDSTGQKYTSGTNIRIFNSKENQWHMAWIDKTNRRTAIFTAKNENGQVVMNGTNATGRHVRNTFFNITKQNFDWKQEWTFDDGNTWVEVVRIKCNRK